MKKRGVRLLTGALMPVAVAACMTFILIYIDQTLAHEETLGFNLLLFYLIMGYVVFGVQSILYSIVMEYIVNPMIRNHFIVVGISIALCMLFGAFSNISPEPIPAIIVVVPGFVTGLYLRWSYVKAAKKHIKSNPTTPHS